jgi:uncharacterized membrane protein YgcG
MALESSNHARTTFSKMQLVIYILLAMCAVFFFGGLYFATVESSTTIKFTMLGNDFSSNNVGIAFAIIGAILFVYISRPIFRSIDSVSPVGGEGGSAEVIGDGEAYGGRGGNSGSFGPGGNGGNASVRGSGKAKGGAGGNGK